MTPSPASNTAPASPAILCLAAWGSPSRSDRAFRVRLAHSAVRRHRAIRRPPGRRRKGIRRTLRAATRRCGFPDSFLAHSLISGRPRPGECPEADDGPDAFEHNEADLKGMERNPKQDQRSSRVENVVGGAAGVDPSHLVPGVGDQDEKRSDERNELASQVHIWLKWSALDWFAGVRNRIR